MKCVEENPYYLSQESEFGKNLYGVFGCDYGTLQGKVYQVLPLRAILSQVIHSTAGCVPWSWLVVLDPNGEFEAVAARW